MKKLYLLPLIIVISMFFKLDVSALNVACTQKEQMRLRTLANATQITYEFVDDAEEPGFTVKISGFSSDFYVYDKTTDILFKYIDNPIVKMSGLIPGSTNKLPFYASDTGICSGYFIMTKTLTLPKYNKYYSNSLCKGHETFELCKKFSAIKIPSYNYFYSRITQHIREDEKQKIDKKDNPVTEEKNFFEKTIKFLADNYIILSIATAVVVISSVVFIQIRKRRRIL